VLLADDQAVVRRGLRTILEAEPDIEVVGETADGVEAVALAHRRAAEGSPRRACWPHPATGDPIDVLVMTTFDLDEVVFEALRTGAVGFLLESAEPETLVAALRTVPRGHSSRAQAFVFAYEHGLARPGRPISPHKGSPREGTRIALSRS
jgi:DNA-binding NarL/FixJ family response regulator